MWHYIHNKIAFSRSSCLCAFCDGAPEDGVKDQPVQNNLSTNILKFSLRKKKKVLNKQESAVIFYWIAEPWKPAHFVTALLQNCCTIVSGQNWHSEKVNRYIGRPANTVWITHIQSNVVLVQQQLNKTPLQKLFKEFIHIHKLISLFLK